MEIARRESELAEMKLLESTLTEKWKDKVKLVEYGDDKCINDECPVCLTVHRVREGIADMETFMRTRRLCIARMPLQTPPGG